MKKEIHQVFYLDINYFQPKNVCFSTTRGDYLRIEKMI